MAYRIRHKDSRAQASLRRIAREEVQAAVRSLDTAALDTGDAVHGVRKRIKRIRALLRLVRPSFEEARAENAFFRGIASPLGPPRDAAVLVQTFDRVVTAAAPGDADPYAPIRHRLLQHRQAIDAAQDPVALLRTTREALQDALPRIATWQLDEDGFDAFEAGLKSSYRRGRKAMRAARRHEAEERFHEWRKHAKDHTFHLRLLQPIWPGPMRAVSSCAAELGDTLGLHHDLSVLGSRVHGMSDIGSDAIASLVARIGSQQRELELHAAALGARLYAESPSALAKAWRRRYAAWRAQG